MRLATRISWKVILPAMILAMGMAVAFQISRWKTSVYKVQEELWGASAQAGELFSSRVEQIERSLGDLLANFGMDPGMDPSGRREALARLLQLSPDYRSIEVCDGSGAVLVRMPEGTAPRDRSGETWFQEVLRQGGSVRWEPARAIRVSRGVFDAKGELALLATVSCSLDAFAGSLERLRHGDMQVSLEDATGNVQLELGSPIQGETLVAAAALSEIRGTLLLKKPVEASLGGIYEDFWIHLGLVGACVLALFVILWRGVRSNVLVPLRGIAAVAEAFQAGEDLPPPDRRLDSDLAALDHTLRKLIDGVTRSRDEYLELNNTLEARVRQRTEQLKVQADELKKARDDARAASKAKGEFLANMCHEIRTPMNGILGMSALLIEADLEGEPKDHARTVKNCGEALLTVINDILDFSKIEAGKMILEETFFDLRELLEEICDLMAAPAQRNGLEIVCDLPPRLPARLRGDPVRIRQIVSNLLGNAVKFTSEGEVVLCAEILEDGPFEVGLRLSIRDTGIGIPAERLDAVFDSFTQVDSSTTRRFGGTGLGLAICRQLAELMGGRIGVESVEDEGSCFWLELALPKESEPKARAVPGLQTLHGKKVLVVDDNPTSRAMILRHLGSWGCRCVEASGGAEALDFLGRSKTHGVGAILVDREMPGMDGLKLAGIIRERFGNDAPPMVLLSALTPRSTGAEVPPARMTSAEARRLGFAASLPKPLRVDALRRGLLRALEGPPAQEDAAEPRTGSQRIPTPSGLSILVAEDNPVNQRVATLFLERLGHHVTLANNGQEALEKSAETPFNAILMDVQMPEMDGMEATCAIRIRETRNRSARIPIIAMTAHAMEGDRDRCLSAGMDDYISKPIKPEDLAAALRRWAPASPPPAPIVAPE